MVARSEVDARSYLWPDRTVPYQQWGTASPTGDRPDCSGYVGGCCWGIPVPVNTVTLVTDGWMDEIDPSDLQPGDAIGHCGPGTAGNDGHIIVFLGWSSSGLFVAEQNGDGPGPVHHTIKRIPVGYKAYRFNGITDGAVAPEEDDMKPFTVREPASGSVWLCDFLHRRGVTSPAEWERLKEWGIVHRGDLPAAESIDWYGALVRGSAAPAAISAEELARIEAAAAKGGREGAIAAAPAIADAVADEEHDRLAG